MGKRIYFDDVEMLALLNDGGEQMDAKFKEDWRRSDEKYEADLLKKLSRSKDPEVQSIVASHPRTPERVLLRMAKSADVGVQRFVAGNPGACLETLKILAEGKTVLQHSLLGLDELPDEVLDKLAKSESFEVRMRLACRKDVSGSVLQTLSKDKVWPVRMVVAKNPLTSADIIAKLADDKAWQVRMWVASRKDIAKKHLKKLAEDEAQPVRLWVASNPNTPKAVLKQLLADKDEAVAENAAISMA